MEPSVSTRACMSADLASSALSFGQCGSCMSVPYQGVAPRHAALALPGLAGNTPECVARGTTVACGMRSQVGVRMDRKSIVLLKNFFYFFFVMNFSK